MDGIAWSAAAMAAARQRLEAAAENLANASTDGFHGVRLRGRVSPGGIAFARWRDSSQGALRPTQRTLDLALAGPGTFALRDGAGRIVRSRGGSFVRDRFGRICDGGGRCILGRRGPLQFPDGARLESDGRVVKDGTLVDRIALPKGASIRSGFLEAANVDAIGEMVDLLTAQRSFESAQKTLTEIDQTRERSASQTASVRA